VDGGGERDVLQCESVVAPRLVAILQSIGSVSGGETILTTTTHLHVPENSLIC
jgi:hypothetical protein